MDRWTWTQKAVWAVGVLLLSMLVGTPLAKWSASAIGAPAEDAPAVFKELTVETLRVKHPAGKYTLTLTAIKAGAWVTIDDGAGRMVNLTVNDFDSGIIVYRSNRGGSDLEACLGARRGDDPVLAVRDPDATTPDGMAVFPRGRVGFVPDAKTNGAPKPKSKVSRDQSSVPRILPNRKRSDDEQVYDQLDGKKPDHEQVYDPLR